MATIKIEPIETESKGGHPVRISGLCLTDTDCLVGDITSPDTGFAHDRWNLQGKVRNRIPSCDLDMTKPALAALVELARLLGAKE